MAAKIAGEEAPVAVGTKQEKIIGSKTTRQYFLPGMPGYRLVKPEDRVEFPTEAEALRAGFRRAAGQDTVTTVSPARPSSVPSPAAPTTASSAAPTEMGASVSPPPTARAASSPGVTAGAPIGGSSPSASTPSPPPRPSAQTAAAPPPPVIAPAPHTPVVSPPLTPQPPSGQPTATPAIPPTREGAMTPFIPPTTPSGEVVTTGPPAPPVPQPAAPTGKDTRYVTIDFDNVDIQVFVKFVSELTGKNFVIDEKVKGKVTVISPKKIAVDEVYRVFQSVLEINGFATVPAGDVIKIVPAMEVRGKGVETRIDEEVQKPEDRIVTQIISLEYANADEMKKIIEPLVSKNSIVLAYAPTGMLIITDVLSNIKRLQEIIGALDVEGVGEQISYIPLKFATAAEIAKSLTAIFQQHRGVAPIRIVAEERTNAIIMLASETDTARIKHLIGMMDKGVTKGESLLHLYKLQNATAEDLAKVLMNLPKDAKAGQAPGKAVLSK
ncbi:MAG: hypothetical protein N2Z74_01625, partial [Syntrophales bacterium]|nr:hypothetical protein [Syntrophales bacterium]